MAYIVGALLGVGFLIAGYFLGRLSVPKQTFRGPYAEMPEELRKVIEQQEDRNRQWDNLMNYTGKVQVTNDDN